MNEESMSIGQRLIGVLLSPVKTFKAIGEDPRFITPALIILVLTALLTALVIPETRELARMLGEKNPQMTPEMIEKSVQFSGIGAVIGVVFITPLLWLIQAGLLSLYNQLSIGHATFKQLYAVSVYSSLPSLINTILITALTKILGTQSMMSIKTSLALLLPPSQNSGFLFNFLNSANLFTIWALVLLSIGGAAVMGKEGKKVGIYIFALWLVFILITALVYTKLGTGAPTL